MVKRVVAILLVVSLLLSSCATTVIPRMPEDVRGTPLPERRNAYDTFALELGKSGIKQGWMTGANEIAQPQELKKLINPVPGAVSDYNAGRTAKTWSGILIWTGLAGAAFSLVVTSEINNLKDTATTTYRKNYTGPQVVGLISAGFAIGSLLVSSNAKKNYQKAVDSYNEALAATYDLAYPSGGQAVAAMLKEKKIETVVVAATPAASPATAKPAAPTLVSDVDTVRPATSPYAKNSIAVVIGNKDYRKGTNPVEFALRDAATMKDLFLKSFRLDPNDVWLYENAGFADLISVFGSPDNVRKSRIYRSAALRDDPPDLFVYYSGHGAPSTSGETRGKGYLIPVDADLMAIADTGYAIDDLIANVNTMRKNGIVKSAWIVFDACFSGQSGDGSQIVKNVSGLAIKPVAPEAVEAGTTLMFASSGEEFASWYPGKGHGLFTYFLLKGLEGAADSDKNRRISMPELDSYLRRQVPRFANGLNGQEQTPQVFYDKADGDMLVYN